MEFAKRVKDQVEFSLKQDAGSCLGSSGCLPTTYRRNGSFDSPGPGVEEDCLDLSGGLCCRIQRSSCGPFFIVDGGGGDPNLRVGNLLAS